MPASPHMFEVSFVCVSGGGCFGVLFIKSTVCDKHFVVAAFRYSEFTRQRFAECGVNAHCVDNQIGGNFFAVHDYARYSSFLYDGRGDFCSEHDFCNFRGAVAKQLVERSALHRIIRVLFVLSELTHYLAERRNESPALFLETFLGHID